MVAPLFCRAVHFSSKDSGERTCSGMMSEVVAVASQRDPAVLDAGLLQQPVRDEVAGDAVFPQHHRDAVEGGAVQPLVLVVDGEERKLDRAGSAHRSSTGK